MVEADIRQTLPTSTMPYLATILITLLLVAPAMSAELFRYRGAAMDGGTLEYIFETDEQDVPKIVSKERKRLKSLQIL